MFKRFSVSSSSLSLLKNQEKGIVSRFSNQQLSEKMTALGIIPGITITLVKRHPFFAIEVENSCIRLDPALAHAIYVRVRK